MRVLFFFLALLFGVDVVGQNLVPNPSFEDTVACPTSDNQVHNALGWSNYEIGNTPDYFNSCAPNNYFGTPNNWAGYQIPSSGNGYCAIGAFQPDFPNIREIIGRNLSSSLVVGSKYYFSMKVSLSIDSSLYSSYACNKLGVRFSTISYSHSPINNFAHIWTDSIITDTLNWTTIFGSFVADSAYNYLALGNFFDDTNTDTIKMVDGIPPYIFSYYYIDDICLSTDSAYCQNYGYTAISQIPQQENDITIYPNPADSYLTIESTILPQNISISIYDLSGRIIQNKQLENSSTNLINILDIPNGMYLLNINIDNSIYRQKIIINH